MDGGILAAIIIFLSGLGIGIPLGRKSSKTKVQAQSQGFGVQIAPTAKKKSLTEEFYDRLAVLAKTTDAKSAFSKALNESRTQFSGSDRVAFEDMLKAALDLNFGEVQLVSIMAEVGKYSTKKIAQFLGNYFDDMKIEKFPALLFPHVSGVSSKEKMDDIFSALDDVFDLDNLGNDREKLISAFFSLGCSETEIAESLYNNTSSDIGDVITAMKWSSAPAAIGALAKTLNVDLTESDEYQSIRDMEGIDFKTAAAILKESGKTAVEILDAENEYSEIGKDDEDEMKNIIVALSEIGFSKKEILDAIWETDFTNELSAGETVGVLRSAETPVSEIVPLLVEKSVDAEDLDQQLRDDTDMELEMRVMIVGELLKALKV